MAEKDKTQCYGTGRRKTSVARVFLRPGSGNIIINTLPANDYFTNETARMVILQPLKVVDMLDKCDIKATVRGGGMSGQAGAIRLGIARALLQYDQDHEEDETGGDEAGEGGEGRVTFRKVLKGEGLLTRDARKVERKKAGLRKARKSVQYSKR